MKKRINLSLAVLLITILILQSGCMKDGNNTQYPDITAHADTIDGILKYKQTDNSGTKVVDWPFGTGTIQVLEGGNDIIATASINDDGSFTLILPATLSGNYFVSLADEAAVQGGTIKATPATVRFAGATQYRVQYIDNAKNKTMLVSLHTLKADLSIDRSYFYNFYDMDGTFAGTGSGASGNKFNWTFTKGWGLVENYQVSSSSEAIDSKSVNSALPNAIWVN